VASHALVSDVDPAVASHLLVSDVDPAVASRPLVPDVDPAVASHPLVRDVDRFFAEGGDVITYFVPEATEHLEVMAASLLALERDGRDEEQLATVFRAVHTLKGAAYTVGCPPIGDLAHEIEDLLAAVRERRVAFSPAVVGVALAGVDALKAVVESAAGAPAELGERLERAMLDVRARMSAPNRAEPALAEPQPVAVEQPALEPPAPAAPARPIEVGRPVRAVQRPRARAGRGNDPSIRVRLDRLDSLMNLVGELMIARSRLEQRLTQLDRVGESLLFSRSRMTRTVHDFEGKHDHRHLSEARGPDRTAPGAAPADAAATMAELFAELEFDRYDDFSVLARSLVEMSADLGEVQAQHAALIRAVREDMAHIQRLTVALRQEVTRSRMVPIGRLFALVARQVREAARATGTLVAFEVHGESVEVDNATVEHMSESLLHLVQNAIAHGIEPEEERLRAGKPARGTISLRALRQGAFIVVEIEDDGRGMDPELLKDRAVELGLIAAAQARALSTTEALNLIFLPGFSTASSVTRAAGRGVGMDVVRTNVTRLNGEIEVDTELGARARFRIKLPLTVAMVDALMVRAGSLVLAVPVTMVGTMRLVDAAAIQTSGDRETVSIDGQSVGVIRLGRVLGLAEGETRTRIPIFVLRAGGTSVAVAVDELLGKEEIVIKSLGPLLDGVGPFAGATISAEGRVILLIDPPRLLEFARRWESLHGGARGVIAEASPGRGDDAARRRVLLVDDSISVRRFVGQMLEKAGFDVFTAVDGHAALERLTEISVDVIVTDLEMPRINGYALIEDLRRRRATRDTPIVVLTTRAGEKHRDLARRLGVQHYVTKPVAEEAFIDLLETIVSPISTDLAAIGGRA
jgi:chemosensory pili system protein ChpA (sensor histidine kinase/response regulator)